MDSVTTQSEDALINSLSFNLPSIGGYVTERRTCTNHTNRSNSGSASSGTTVLKFRLSSDGWLDPNTFRVMFNVVDDDDDGLKAPRPLGHVYALLADLCLQCMVL